MEANFKNGKMIIKSGRITIAKIYHRPDFFRGLKVSYNENYPYSLEVNGIGCECKTFEEAVELLMSEVS